MAQALECGWGQIKSATNVMGKTQWARRFYWLDQKCVLYVYEDEAIDSRCDRAINVSKTTFLDNCHVNPGEFIFCIDSGKPITVRFNEGDKWRQIFCSKVAQDGLSSQLRSSVRNVPQGTIQGGLRVEIIEAKELPSKKGDGSIDPYCVVFCDGVQVYRGCVATHMWWNTSFCLQFFCYSLPGNVEVHVWDNKTKQCVGQCR